MAKSFGSCCLGLAEDFSAHFLQLESSEADTELGRLFMIPNSKVPLNLDRDIMNVRKIMKLLDYRYCYDFGHEWYLSFLRNKKWSVLHINLNADEYFAVDASFYVGINKGCPLQVGVVICNMSLYVRLFSECYY